MQQVTITEVVYTSDIAGADLFNSNFLPNANSGETPWGGNGGNELGNPTNETLDALGSFDVDYVRFPAGQDKELFSEHGILTNGDLPDFVREFLTHAQANGVSVSMVVPVETLEQFGGPSEATIHTDLETFAEIIERDFPGVVQHYELGNEYWGKRETDDPTRETTYGEAAAKAALALQVGTQAAGGDVDVVLQTASFLGNAYGNDITAANAAIQAGWESVTTDTSMISGVLRNFYWRDPGVNEFHNTEGTFAENRGIDESFDGADGGQWDDWAGRDLMRVVGEYNIMNSVENNLAWHSDLGVHGASMFLEHMTNMIDAGVDLAFVWPLLHSTKNALIHRHEDIEYTDVHDLTVVTNGTRAAIFDVLRQTVSDYQLVEFQWDTDIDVELTGFEGVDDDGTNERVVFFSSRSDDAETFQIDLSDFVGTFYAIEGISIHYAEDGDDNHRDAVVTEYDATLLPDGETFEITLQPFEVVQLVFDVTETPVGTAGDDILAGSSRADGVAGLDGDDIIHGHGGADTLDGGDGNDFIDGGDGDDELDGQDGADVIHGGAGADYIVSGNGNDTVYGGEGDDHILTGGNSDLAFGGDGNDYIDGGWGFDTLSGDGGNDTLNGGAGWDVLTGGEGQDTFIFDRFDGAVDRVTDFQIGLDQLDFDFSDPDGPDGIIVDTYVEDESSIVRFVKDGEVRYDFGGVILDGVVDKDYFIAKSEAFDQDLYCYI